jgi:hypothetical protein
MHYNSDILSKDLVKRISNYFEHLLYSAAQNTETPVGQLRWIPKEEGRHILETFGRGPEIDSARLSQKIHQLFEGFVAVQPSAIACTHEGQTLTYGTESSVVLRGAVRRGGLSR